MTYCRRSRSSHASKRLGQDGQGLAEYAVVLALIACVSIVALLTLGSGVTNAFAGVSTAVGNAAGASVAPTAQATVAPTAQATVAPTAQATVAPTAQATVAPTAQPTVAPEPTKKPHPTKKP